ncbi:conserved membrane hypothetical protein [Candidatus Sulfopaludibacter sp. SbA3]|nr:conserved membrane hypothetical protein [Candidatus Sulfopaludibacter sp. SbA3]
MPGFLGLGAADLLLLLAGALLIAGVFAARRWVELRARSLAPKTGWCMLLLAVLPIALRLLLLSHHPVPSPDIYDEFGHLLVADTLRHFRLANPPLPRPEFFETFFVLQQPTYSSIYPIGQGLALALGWTLFGLPWGGVLLSTAAFCALCYWMLRGWTSPEWALAGGLLAVAEFGPLNQWMNSYWGGTFPAMAGCLVFGALPRLRDHSRTCDAVLLAVGLALHWLTRPFESLFLFLAVALYFAPYWRAWRRLAKVAPEAALILATACAITFFHNKAVTGSWTTLPEKLSQEQYGVPAALTFQANPTPTRPLTPQQALDYRMQLGFRGTRAETLRSYLERLEYRVRYYRFFFFPPLYLALAAFLFTLRHDRHGWVALTCLLFALGVNFFPAFQLHYVAAVTCLFVLMSVAGLEALSRVAVRAQPAGADAARLILLLCAAQFLFWYGLHLFDNSAVSLAMRPYETWDNINHGNPERRIFVDRQLAQIPGRLLVLVHYRPLHIFQDEWVYNSAGPANSRIIWARDLGPEATRQLLQVYPGRTVLMFEPDARPPRLSPWMSSAKP